MSKSPVTEAQLGMPPAVISHTFIRLRGTQRADVTVYHAGEPSARVSLTWGGILMNFCNAQAAQGVLEGFSAARTTLVHLPAEVSPIPREPYDQPAIVIDWTRRPSYAAMPRSAVAPDKSRTLRWTDVYMGPVTYQVLDRAAFHGAIEVLQLAHNIAIAVCVDGPRFAADPTRDDYRPQQ